MFQVFGLTVPFSLLPSQKEGNVSSFSAMVTMKTAQSKTSSAMVTMKGTVNQNLKHCLLSAMVTMKTAQSMFQVFGLTAVFIVTIAERRQCFKFLD